MKDDGDGRLFRETIGEVAPLKQAGQVIKKIATKATPGHAVRRRAAQESVDREGNFLARQEYISLVKPTDVLSFKRDGVQHGVFRNIKRGRYAIDAVLDLHGQTVNQARDTVFSFLAECIEREIRCAMITHGKGQFRQPPALLKSCVNHWLRQLEEVLAFHSAQPQHGGSGATYILVRKSATQKIKNSERFSKATSR
jgi:DNA-nicking Smr family endonuclease